MNNQLSIKKAILYAVNAVVSHPWYFVALMLYWIGLTLGLLVSFVVLSILVSPFYILPFAGMVSLFGYFAWYALITFILILPTKLLLRFYDQGAEPFSLKLFLTQFNIGMLIKLVALTFIVNFMVSIGLLLFIIPGIYVAIKFVFSFLYLVDTNCGIIEALKKSYNATTGNFWRLMALVVIATLLFYLIIPIPVSMLMMIYAYRQLNQTH